MVVASPASGHHKSPAACALVAPSRGCSNVMTNATITPPHDNPSPAAARLVDVASSSSTRSHAVVRLGGIVRVALLLEPRPGRSLADEMAEVLDAVRGLQRRHDWPLVLTTQTVFLREAADEAICDQLLRNSPEHHTAVTHYTVQPPANGARLAVEAWAVAGPGVTVEPLSVNATLVGYDGLRWLHTGNVKPAGIDREVQAAALDVFARNGELLSAAGMGWENVVRTWWYLGGITEAANGTQRYMEMNRARAEAFARLHFGNSHMAVTPQGAGYPASTGIGMKPGAGLSLATLALQTRRQDVRLLPLENPLQTPAYDYAARYSPQSPKFSRAMALVLPDYVTTWISGTASIVHSEVCHCGDVVAQTEQTLDNMAALIAPENFARHGQSGAGATLRDLAKVRVYVKRAADVSACRAVCQRRLGNLPAVYVVADVCRPELLVEIEGVAFSRRSIGAFAR
jgi:enamine deaminase RidA (YjgF/YER057c/UK114 family)